MKTLEAILNQRNLSALFQPVMDLANGTFMGFEGLIRGPANSPLHSPINLFAAAKQQGVSLEVEMLCRQIVLESYRMVEVGRSCVHSNYRDGATISQLWSGLAQYMQQHRHEYLIGCASISIADGGHVAASVYRKLLRIYGAPAEYSVFPRNPLPLHALNQYLDAPIPPLIKGYLRLGAYICGEPAWDPEFNTADLFILLPMSRMSSRYAKHFLG